MHRRRLALLALLTTACGGAATHADTTPAPVATSVTETPFTEASIDAVHGVFVASMDVAVTSFGAVAEGGSVYVAGGYHGTPHEYDREGQSHALARLDADGSWHALAEMESGLQGFGMVAEGGALVRCGGLRVDNARGAPTDMHSIATCRRFVLATGAWEPFPDLPEPRSSFDMAVSGQRIYVVGGWNVEGDQSHTTYASTMLVYDLASGAWTREPCPITRRALALVPTPSGVAAIGGLDAALHTSRAVDLYDASTHAWTSGPEFPGDGFGMAAASDGTHLVASGADGTLYTLEGATWTASGTLVQPRFFHRLVVSGEDVLAIGGIGSMTMDGRARLIERVGAAGPAWGWVELSFPGDARNRFAAFVREDSLFVLGGNTSPEQHDFAPENFSTRAYRLHVPSLRWFALPALPEGRQSMESLAIGEGVEISLGGFGHDGRAARTFADGFVTDAEGAITLARDALPTGRTQFGAAVWGDAVWVVAGLVFDESLPEDQQFTHLDDVLRCPLVEGRLGACETIEARLPGTRRAFASAAVGDRFYVVGGMRDGFAPVEDCFVFDFAARSFAPFACPAHVRISATMLAHGGHLVLAGGSARGEGGLVADRSIEVFDPASGAWTTAIAALPFDTHQGRWAFVGDRLVMLSTQPDAGHARLAVVALP